MVKLMFRLYQEVSQGDEASNDIYHKSLKVVEFMMKFHYGNPKKGEASVETSPHGFSHSYELVSNLFHKRN